ncbi:hypothetical protein ACFL2R_02465 [Patescibacteria group bacterium]
MTLKSYIWGMRIATVTSLIVWLVVINGIDPIEAGLVGQVFFYLSFWLFLSGVFVLFLSWLRKFFMGEEIAFACLGMSFRQGVLLSLIGVGLLFMQGAGVLVWWDGFLLATGVFLVELYFLSR